MVVDSVTKGRVGLLPRMYSLHGSYKFLLLQMGECS
jgi:hypothetical protein